MKQNFIPFLLFFLLFAGIFIGCDAEKATSVEDTAPAPEIPAEPEVFGTLKVTGSNVNIRDCAWVFENCSVTAQGNPGDEFEILGIGDIYRVGKKIDRWYQIRGDFGTGYIFGAFTDRAIQHDQSAAFMEMWNKIPPKGNFDNGENASGLQLDNTEVFLLLEDKEVDPETFGMSGYGIDGRLEDENFFALVWEVWGGNGGTTMLSTFDHEGFRIGKWELGTEFDDFGGPADLVEVKNGKEIIVTKRHHGNSVGEIIVDGVKTYKISQNGDLKEIK